MYKLGQRSENKRSKKLKRLIALMIFILIVAGVVIFILSHLKPKTSINQSTAVTKKISYTTDSAIKTYDEPDFSINLPSTWKLQPRPNGPYQSYTWNHINKSQNGEQIVIYEDIIPLKYAVNRVLILEPQATQVSIKGGISDNCNTYTKNISQVPNQVGASAKWQGIDFLCDQNNLERDVVGTSSLDGINTVSLNSPSGGGAHKFFFTYTNQSINGDYSVFTDAVTSFKMK